MLAIEASQFRNLIIEIGAVGADSGEGGAPNRASVEFLCSRTVGDDELMSVPIAVSEFALADLVGHPHLLERIERADGRVEFRYELMGTLWPHRSLS